MTSPPSDGLLAPPPQALRQISEDSFYVVNEVVTKKLGHLPIAKVLQLPHIMPDKTAECV